MAALQRERIPNRVGPTTAESVMSVVDQAEQSLVKSCFREALELSNTILCRDDESTNHQAVQLFTPLDLFQNRNTTGCVSVDWTRNSDDIDRAAAVALQSWFEIDLIAQRHPHRERLQKQGLAHLRPFLDRFMRAPMSIELLVVLVRFCQATDHFSLAVNLSMEVVTQARQQRAQRQLLSYDASISANEMTKSHLKELLLILLLDLLPYCQDAATLLDTPQLVWAWEPKQWVSSYPEPQAIPSLIEWSNRIEEEENSWFVETVLDCREQWKLEEVKRGGNSLPVTNLLPTTNMKVSLMLKVLSREWRVRLWLKMQEYVSQVLLIVREAPSKILEDSKQRNQVAMTLLSFWIAWRYRRRLLSTSSATFQKVIWQPAREIVDAIIVPR